MAGHRGLRVPDNVPESLRDGIVVLRSAPGKKISLRLIKLVEPFRHSEMDVEDFQSLIALAASAWNLCVLPAATIDEFIGQLPVDSAAEMRAVRPLLDSLVARKRRMFPDDDRFITGWDVALQPDGGFFLTAAALSC
jgi:hypothetical protein